MMMPLNRADAEPIQARSAHRPEQILIAYDDPQACQQVSVLLASAGYRVMTACNSACIFQALAARNPDLVVLDVAHPEIHGFELGRQIRSVSNAPIIFLSSDADVQNRVVALRSGGDDFLAKPFEPAELLARLAALLRRNKWNHVHHSLILDPVEQTASFDHQRAIRLTSMETRLLRYLIGQAGMVLKPGEICRALWGRDDRDLRICMRVHIRHLRMKIEPDVKHPRYIRTIRSIGYRFVFPA